MPLPSKRRRLTSGSMSEVKQTSAARDAASQNPVPSPALLFDTINAHQKTAAIKAAIELDIFSVLADAAGTAETIAPQVKASPRGVRILCDFLTTLGLLTKAGDRYALTPDSAV